ncbi:MAG: hypothetical protein DRJ08_02695 [Acidobacteria bacterium]|nr:MAG: hypothetical protein DRJ08_02695 [Acidobacteriota bacterium]
MKPEDFFMFPKPVAQRQYEALRAFYVEGLSATEAAKRFGYTLSAFYSLTRDFTRLLEQDDPHGKFFVPRRIGRKPKDITGRINAFIIALRKEYLSVPDIKAILDVRGFGVSEKYVYNVIEKNGFARLPRRNGATKKKAASAVKIEASQVKDAHVRAGGLHLREHPMRDVPSALPVEIWYRPTDREFGLSRNEGHQPA